MINMRRAFTKHTTTRAYLVLHGDGYFDEYNEWVRGEETPPQPFSVTVTPIGNSEEASYGSALDARPEGERIKTYLQFTSRTDMPMNSFIYYRQFKFKVVQEAEYTAAGFHSVIAENVRGKEEYDD